MSAVSLNEFPSLLTLAGLLELPWARPFDDVCTQP